ncbi:MAG: VCBS repeat-containing protein [Polyangiaceae bacterium]|nr:VCBS repeat-containing protein [Polyangiaceae bacterium]MCW5790563.1 VCBS repeat-containing protein [Polyangiaceae bacterium]
MKPSPRLLGSSLALVGAVALSGACGSDGSTVGGGGINGGSGGSTTAGTGGTNPGGSTFGGTGGSIHVDSGPGCSECDGGVCIQGVCCDPVQACGNVCCGGGEVCSFQTCEVPKGTCVDSDDCGANEYCEYSLGEPASSPDAGATPDGGAPACVEGATPATGRCLTRPPTCANGEEPGDPIQCLQACEYRPPVGEFNPTLKHTWEGTHEDGQIMMAPIVIQLDDDNCDGKVDAKDIPEILFTTFKTTRPATGDNGAAIYSQNGTLRAISIVNGQVVEKWSYYPDEPFDDRLHPGAHLAAGNIDGLPGNEIIVCTQDGRARAVAADGTPMWVSTATGCHMPAIADMDQDGIAEVLIGGAVLDGATGNTKFPISGGNAGTFADVDGDGYLEVVGLTGIYDRHGTQIATQPLGGSYLAVGDFNRDGTPEIVSVNSSTHMVHVWVYDAAEPNGVRTVRQDIDINGTFTNHCAPGSAGATRGGGPPTIADFNSDGTPDVAIATGIGYTVLDGLKLLDPTVPNDATNMWLKETKDCSSAATGSSVFDFDGDGQAEVVYADEHTLRIYNGANGDELWSTCNTSGTLTEYPLVADVDNDGHADLIVIANDYSGLTCLDDTTRKVRGLRVFGDTAGKWVRTRRVWNQHTYHVTNVNEDGSIPLQEERNWSHPRLNNFRQNIQPSGEFSAPDLVVEVRPSCDRGYSLVARVRNIGLAAVPPGVVVGFYLGDPAAGGTRLGEAVTTRTLGPAQAEDVTLDIASPSTELTSGATPVYAVVDDGGPPHAWVQCRTDNDQSQAASGRCDGIR